MQDYLNNRCWSCGKAVPHGGMCCGTILSNRRQVVEWKSHGNRQAIVLRDSVNMGRGMHEDYWGEMIVERYEDGKSVGAVIVNERKFTDYQERAYLAAHYWC